MFSSNTSAVSGDANYIEDVFSTWLYTGTGSALTVTNGIDLAGKGGLVWLKGRSAISAHWLGDSARGASNILETANTGAQYTDASVISSFSSTGFSVGSANAGGTTYASWTFRKQPKFFDVVTYTGTGANRTVAHNLGSVPGFIIVKRTDAVADWQCYHRSLANTQYMVLNSTAAAATGATRWNSTTPTSTVFSLGTDTTVNASGGTYVAYLFAHDAGGFGLTGTDNVISCGSYTGNGSATGPEINLGYEPQYVLIKNASATGYWFAFDNMRGIATGGTDALLWPNVADAEANSTDNIDLTATGFRIKNSAGSINGSGNTLIYIAIRRGPMKVPTSGTSVFEPLSRSGTSAVATISSSGVGPVDMILAKSRNISNDPRIWDRLRGPTQRLSTDTTDQEVSTAGVVLGFDSMTGVRVQDATNEFINTSGAASPYINYMLKRAPGFFDEVCYTGTGANRTVAHNLAAVPELMIVKSRTSAVQSWYVYSSAIWGTSIGGTSGADGLRLNANLAATQNNTQLNNTQPTASVFSLGTVAATNENGATFVNYLFATCAGVSKVGSYTGTGTTLQINCGFTAGARFVLIKRADSTGDWYVWDSARGIVAGNDPYLLLNSTAAEVTSTDYVDTYSAGFEISSTAPAAINASGGTFIFLAIS